MSEDQMSADAYTSGPVDRVAQEVREGAADAVLAVAVRSYTAFAIHVRFHDDMTEDVLPVLWSVIPEEERDTYPVRLEEFVNTYRERLARLYAEYGPQSVTAQYGRRELLAYPVSLIVLEQLVEVRSRYALAARWNGKLPDRWLNDVSATWGVGALL
ncbi:hypothetical protein GCM10010329_85890 [Streptomyces spiroverticillatus]|uniref:Uncharacterized protein n=1 Tax=Streptomyces finlayi TaxID=67296 RepID=A0A918XAF5_9ACTN|nr:hypothetical protein [Streptomyces finlayi]GHA50723.1 hypothetical protein GCM10010329_85890 [Streptomyces spiroverticillatus]GHD19945.1 hypothetical protein GCM10010334_84000 [Streptomyces finlayi]